MKFSNSIAYSCRYGEIADSIWGDWDVIWEDSSNDYQGHVSFLARNNGSYVYYEYAYGSCSGCDDWECRGLTDTQVANEMAASALVFEDIKQLGEWLDKFTPDKYSYYGIGAHVKEILEELEGLNQ